MNSEPSTRHCGGQAADGMDGIGGGAARAAEGKRASTRRIRPWSSIGVCCCLGLAATTGCQQQGHAFVVPAGSTAGAQQQPRWRAGGSAASRGGSSSTALGVAQVRVWGGESLNSVVLAQADNVTPVG